MYDILSTQYNSPFDQFREMQYLEEDHCKDITGWTKTEFIKFADYITNVKNSQKRTKEQLIALYRYWLRTGIDHKSLASKFSVNTKQYQISEYLAQIRIAIMKDFVPHYLGARKERDFFLNFNTLMTHKLHDLPTDHLVIVADGTYCRIEKSKNNDFQYKTYSKQKCASLINHF